jgi:hypothetical protein
MSTTKIINRPGKQAVLQKYVDGFNKHSASLPTMQVAGTLYKTADLITIIQARLALSNSVQTTKAAWQSAVKLDEDDPKTRIFYSGLRQAIQAAFAGSIESLADFGLAPRKAHVLTADEKVQSAAKAKATRTARHTMGKVQKQAIKGTVPTAPATAPVATTTPVVVTQPSATSSVVGPAPTSTAPAAPVPAPATAPAVVPTPAPVAAPSVALAPVAAAAPAVATPHS